MSADIELDRHPGSAELLDYYLGDVSLDRREWIQDHLALCPECVRTVLDLDAFPNPAVPGLREHLSSADISAEWERFRERARGARLSGGWRAFVRTALPWGLAAALFIVSLSLGVQTAMLQRQVGGLSRPRGGVELVDLSPVADRIERFDGKAEGVQLSSWADRLVLILNLADAHSFTEYEIEMMAVDGRRVWHGVGLHRTQEGTVVLEVPRQFLAAGSYRIRLFGAHSRGGTPVVEYSLLLRH